ncbi:MAG: hypothetical protein ACI38Q_09150 [Candidatus Bruticola sp.]
MRKFNIFIGLVLSVVLFLGSLAPAVSAAKKKKSDQHPVAVIKATVDRDAFDNDTVCVKRNCTLWVKNLSHDTYKDIKVNIKVYDNKRELESLDKSIDELEPGSRKFLHFKWDDYSRSRKQQIKIWLTYINDEGKEVTFQAPSPVW